MRLAGELAALVGVAVDVVDVQAARQERGGGASDGQGGDGCVGPDELLECAEFDINFNFMVLFRLRKLSKLPVLSEQGWTLSYAVTRDWHPFRPTSVKSLNLLHILP